MCFLWNSSYIVLLLVHSVVVVGLLCVSTMFFFFFFPFWILISNVVLLVREFFVSLPFFDHSFLVSLVYLFYFSCYRFQLLRSLLVLFPQCFCAIKKFGTWCQFGEPLSSSYGGSFFLCARSVRGKSCYFWREFVYSLGGCRIDTEFGAKVFVSYFPAVCVM